ncbi:MAG: M3 family metallopeptidase [bacterium]
MTKLSKLLLSGAATALVLAACAKKQEGSSASAKDEGTTIESVQTAEMTDSKDFDAIRASNPLLQEWDTPFGIPPFDQIKDEDFADAFNVAIADFEAEVAAIIDNPEEPSFDNTIKALETAGVSLGRVQAIFGGRSSTDTNDTIQALESEIYPRLSGVYDEVALNDTLWQKINTLYQERDSLNLATDELRVLELYHRDMVRRGAALDAQAKARMKEINAELSSLTTTFGQNLLAETKGFELVVTDEADLAGLSEDFKALGKKAAEDKDMPNAWVFGLNRSVYEGFMTQSENRELRSKLFDGYRMRGANGNEYDQGETILKIARLRAEAARLRGYKSHADYQLEVRMAKTPEQAEEFLLKVWRPGLARAKQEIAEMQAIADAAESPYKVEGYDWWHLSEKVRQEKYAFDDSALKPYFELSNVQDGAFYLANKLWGVHFTELKDAPRWNERAKVYDLTDADGTHLGVFMADMYARDSKRNGAWMSGFRSASNLDGDNIRPIVTNNLNLSIPAEGQPTLMAFGDVETLFHEFGHGMHGLLTTQRFDRISGVGGPRDYTEFPAQLLEHWASEPQMLAEFAHHYETGEVIPTELVEKMKRAKTHNEGFRTTEFIAASLLDLRWHMLTLEEAEAITDARAFEQKVLAEYGLIPEIEPRYRSPYFAHIFAGGYSAGYYAYLWSEILDSDGFDAFKQTGDIFNPELAKRLRTNIYEAGASEEADVLYRKFRGKDPSIEPLLKNRGFSDGS